MSRNRHKVDQNDSIRKNIERIMARHANYNYEWEIDKFVLRLGARYDKVAWAMNQLVKKGKVRQVKCGGQVPDSYYWINGADEQGSG